MYRNKVIVCLFLFAFAAAQFGGAQNTNETPANVPARPTVAPQREQPVRQQPVRQQPVQRPTSSKSISKDLLPSISIDPIEEKPVYQNMALYVGGVCFLVVFIGLYMIMMSGPVPRAKKKKK